MLVTNGGKQAVYEAFATLLDPGDEVLLPAPYWTTYPEAIRLAGGVPVEVPTTPEGGYLVTVDQLEAAAPPARRCCCGARRPTRRARCAGAGLTREVGRWAVDTGLWVVTDEIYEHLVYGGRPDVLDAGGGPRASPTSCVVVNGVAKTYAMTGWRVGWMIGPPDVVKAATNLQSHSTSNVCNVSQAAALAAVTGDLSAVAEMRAAFDRRRQTMHSMLDAIPGVICPKPKGAFYCYPSVRMCSTGRSAGAPRRRSAELAALDPGRGRGRGRARRGVRHARLPAAVLRAGRRRPGGRGEPARRLLADAG